MDSIFQYYGLYFPYSDRDFCPCEPFDMWPMGTEPMTSCSLNSVRQSWSWGLLAARKAKKKGRVLEKNWCDRSVWFISDTYVKLPVRPPQRPLSLLRGSAVVVAVICQGSWIARNKRSKKEDIVRTFFVRSDQFCTILPLLTQHPSHHHHSHCRVLVLASLLLSVEEAE